jgi:hypothetical protein
MFFIVAELSFFIVYLRKFIALAIDFLESICSGPRTHNVRSYSYNLGKKNSIALVNFPT